MVTMARVFIVQQATSTNSSIPVSSQVRGRLLSQQSKCPVCLYDDHTVDLTRLNAYAGIASGYIIRDSSEAHLRNLGLPDFIENGGREIPIVIQDKIFVGPDIEDQDPTWAAQRRGQPVVPTQIREGSLAVGTPSIGLASQSLGYPRDVR